MTQKLRNRSMGPIDRQREEAATRLLFIHTDAHHSGALKGGVRVRIVTSPSASVIMTSSKYACKHGDYSGVVSAIVISKKFAYFVL